MSARQDKATTDRHARILRELVKQPDNKTCVDCKRNDPRWASWNLGCFLCIRCSGIHRSMGTHISRVKSIDLDMWTPEQMESVQKWGNARANAYWEAHLKAGHVPPDHKIESFIRSKYESRRWAMEGPLPADPSVLDAGMGSAASAPPERAVSPPVMPPPSNPRTPTGTRNPTNRQPQPHQLLSSTVAGRQPAATRTAPQPAPVAPAPVSAAPAAPQPPPQDDFFSLDFHSSSPAPASNGSAASAGGGSGGAKKDVKQDILSLFSTPAAQPAPPPTQSAFGQFTAAPQQNSWAQMGSAVPAQPTQPTSMMGTSGVGAWGASSGWTGQTVVPPVQNNVWASMATPVQPTAASANQGLFASDNIWATSGASASNASNDPFGSFASPGSAAGGQKKDDAFGDLWGGFK